MRRNVPDKTREFPVADIIRDIGGCDLFISLVPWMSQSLRDLLQGLAPAASVGFFDDYATPVALDFTRHAADLTFDPVAQFNATLRLDDFVAPLAPDPRSRSIVDATLGLLPAGYWVLAVHADTGRPKMWLAERLVSALDRFLDRHSDFMVLLVGRRRNHSIPAPMLPRSYPATDCRSGFPWVWWRGPICSWAWILVHVARRRRISVAFRASVCSGPLIPVEYGFRFSPALRNCRRGIRLAIRGRSGAAGVARRARRRGPRGRVLGRRDRPCKDAAEHGGPPGCLVRQIVTQEHWRRRFPFVRLSDATCSEGPP